MNLSLNLAVNVNPGRGTFTDGRHGNEMGSRFSVLSEHVDMDIEGETVDRGKAVGGDGGAHARGVSPRALLTREKDVKSIIIKGPKVGSLGLANETDGRREGMMGMTNIGDNQRELQVASGGLSSQSLPHQWMRVELAHSSIAEIAHISPPALGIVPISKAITSAEHSGAVSFLKSVGNKLIRQGQEWDMEVVGGGHTSPRDDQRCLALSSPSTPTLKRKRAGESSAPHQAGSAFVSALTYK